jgi:hypothetical protein
VVAWEETFRRWSKPSSDTEQSKMENAEAMIRAAIRACPVVAQRTVEIFPQGSYRNNTNVRVDSDVDICVRCMDYWFDDYSQVPDVRPHEMAGLPSAYSYTEFRNEVGAALIRKFGSEKVRRGSKAFDVHATSYRVDADVVAVLEHRRYYRDWRGNLQYYSGTEFHPDSGGRIINWPNQHYSQGVAKNRDTGNRFKYITRVIKRLRYKMEADSVAEARNIPSYLIECLVFNAPNRCFGHDEYVRDVREVLAHLFNNTLNDESCKEWGEVNELKYLFNYWQPWTRQQAFNFVRAGWDYLGLE